MKLFSKIFTIVSLFILVIAYQNCGEGFQSLKTSSSVFNSVEVNNQPSISQGDESSVPQNSGNTVEDMDVQENSQSSNEVDSEDDVGNSEVDNEEVIQTSRTIASKELTESVEGESNSSKPITYVESSITKSNFKSKLGNKTKFNPGHYISLSMSRSYSKEERHKLRLAEIKSLKKESLVRGVKVLINWDVLETSKGKYHLKYIGELLKALEGSGKMLGVYIKERNFSKGCSKPPVPSYIQSYKTKYNGYVCLLKVWEREVTNRKLALYKAIGNAYNTHPNLEYITEGETAVNGDGYSYSKWIKELEYFYTQAKKIFPNTIVLYQINFLNGAESLYRIAKHIESVGGGAIGLPDTVPCRQELIYNTKKCKDRKLTGYFIKAYDVLKDFRGKVSISPFVETYDLYWTVTGEVFDLAVNTLGANHVTWQSSFDSRVNSPGHIDGYLEKQILPTLKKNNSKINKSCPSSFKGGCITLN